MNTHHFQQAALPNTVCRTYEIGGIGFQILCPKAGMYSDDGALRPFRCDGAFAHHTLEFSLVEELSPPEGTCVFSQSGMQVFYCQDGQIRYIGALEAGLSGAYLRILRKGNTSYVQVKQSNTLNRITSKTVLNALEMEHHIVQNGGFLLHASYIAWQGRGILFTAPSGTGKSTQAALWQTLRGARLLNGDRAAITVEKEGVFVHGIPFSGSSGVAEKESLPLSAIVYLSQAPKTQITRLSGVKAFRSIWEGCSINLWNKEDVALCTESVLQAATQIPVFHLACTPDESAVEALEKELTELR